MSEYAHTPPAQTNRSPLGLTALIVGIIALGLSFIPLVNIVAILLGFVSLILGIIALTQKGRKRTAAIIGIVLGAIAIVVSVILIGVYSDAFFGWVENSVTEGTASVD